MTVKPIKPNFGSRASSEPAAVVYGHKLNSKLYGKVTCSHHTMSELELTATYRH